MRTEPIIPSGIIFDCDGTLADTMPLHWRAWSVVTKRYGLHFPEDRFYAYGGVPSLFVEASSGADGRTLWRSLQPKLVGEPGLAFRKGTDAMRRTVLFTVLRLVLSTMAAAPPVAPKPPEKPKQPSPRLQKLQQLVFDRYGK